jgi:hypothetical protein
MSRGRGSRPRCERKQHAAESPDDARCSLGLSMQTLLREARQRPPEYRGVRAHPARILHDFEEETQRVEPRTGVAPHGAFGITDRRHHIPPLGEQLRRRAGQPADGAGLRNIELGLEVEGEAETVAGRVTKNATRQFVEIGPTRHVPSLAASRDPDLSAQPSDRNDSHRVWAPFQVLRGPCDRPHEVRPGAFPPPEIRCTELELDEVNLDR